MSNKIRLLIADGQTSTLREDLHRLISAQEDMEIVGVVDDGSQVLHRVAGLTPDVLLLDLTLTGGGLQILEQMTEMTLHTRAVVLAMHEDISLLRSVLAVGSLGYVVHRDAQDELLKVVRKISAGRSYVEVPTGGLRPYPGLDPQSEEGREMHAKLDLLSQREREVLRAVAYGYTNREIAESLQISVKSIETYRYRVSDKLGFKSRADLVRFALEVGLLQTGAEGLPRSDS